jgi:hypothetical protein
MGLFGVRVNGAARILLTNGTATQPSLSFGAEPTLGLQRTSAETLAITDNGTRLFGFLTTALNLRGAADLVWTNGDAISGTGDTFLHREAANTVKFFDGSTTASTVLVGSVDFRQANSTFAATATMTNGPRAANPIAWLEVKVSGSTGRIPVW